MIPQMNEDDMVVCSYCGDLYEPQDTIYNHDGRSGRLHEAICIHCELDQMEDSIDMWEQ